MVTENGARENSTYVVIAILSQERDPLSLDTVRLGGQRLLRSQHIPDKIPISKAPARDTVHDGRAGQVVVLEGAEQGQIREG